MSTVILICAGIAALFLIFGLAQIKSRLHNIHIDLCHIYEGLARFSLLPLLFKEFKPHLRGPGEVPCEGTERKPAKQREYWRDQNGFKHWRKKDA